MKKLFFMMLCLLVLGSCSKKPDVEKLKKELLATDKAFSDLSVANGLTFANRNTMADKSVILRKNSMPVTGKDSILSVLTAESNTEQRDTMAWTALSADVSASGELGYTYGIYKMFQRGKVYEGTYTTIWKKDKSGKWKFVLDSRTEGLRKPEPEVVEKKAEPKKPETKKTKTKKKSTKKGTTTKKATAN